MNTGAQGDGQGLGGSGVFELSCAGEGKGLEMEWMDRDGQHW